MTPPGRARQEVLSRFERGGIGTDRITFHPRRSRDEYMRGYNEIDISLDTFPYAGHTTSLDAMWMGVPVVSLYGNTCVSRGGLSQLSNLGLADRSTGRRVFVDRHAVRTICPALPNSAQGCATG